MLLLLLIQYAFSDPCICYWEGQSYSCGAIKYYSFEFHECCRSEWCKCIRGYPNGGGCGCCGDQTTIKNKLLSKAYHYTKDQTLCSTHVSKLQDGYVEIVSSDKLRVGDFVIWPKLYSRNVGGSYIHADHDIILTVEHHNVTVKHNKCCSYIRTEHASYRIEFCCGDGCER